MIADTELKKLLTRDWAVRVLDAYVSLQCAEPPGPGPGFITLVDNRPRCHFASWSTEIRRGAWEVTSLEAHGVTCDFEEYETPDAARIAAAEAVFPNLDRNAPNWPGEKP